MARRIKSLVHGNLPIANPYEPATGKLPQSPNHREHRSKKGRRKRGSSYEHVKIYKAKLRELQEKELELELKLWK